MDLLPKTATLQYTKNREITEFIYTDLADVLSCHFVKDKNKNLIFSF